MNQISMFDYDPEIDPSVNMQEKLMEMVPGIIVHMGTMIEGGRERLLRAAYAGTIYDIIRKEYGTGGGTLVYKDIKDGFFQSDSAGIRINALKASVSLNYDKVADIWTEALFSGMVPDKWVPDDIIVCDCYDPAAGCATMEAKKNLQMQEIMEGGEIDLDHLCKRFCCKGCPDRYMCGYRCGRVK